jgi:tetratricopeptide (TPR) repeat protein
MMRLWSAAVALVLACPAAAQFPDTTPEGKKALLELLGHCRKVGGLKVVQDPLTGAQRIELADLARLKKGVADRRALLTPALRNSLVRYGNRPALVTLLRLVGEETKDDQALAFATFFTAFARSRQPGQADAARQGYAEARRLFAKSRLPYWEATCLNNLGIAHQQQGDAAAALKWFEQALALARKVPDPGSSLLLTTLGNLGEVHRKNGDLGPALQYHEEALAVARKVHGDRHPAVASALRTVGRLLHDRGEYARALRRHEEALALFRRLHGEKHDAVATALNDVGLAHARLGAPRRALEQYDAALAIARALHGPEHPAVARTLNNMGSAWDDLADYARARRHYEQALAIYRKVYGEEHREIGVTLNNLGYVHARQGDYKAAVECYERALAVKRKVHGEGHPSVAATLRNLGEVHARRRDFKQAQDHYERALAIERAAKRGRHPDAAAILESLGRLCHDRGDYAGALAYYDQALAIERAAYGERHPVVAHTLRDVAGAHRKRGDYGRALELLRRALAIQEAAFGADHLDVANTRCQIGLVYEELADPGRALRQYRPALAAFRRAHGEEHPDVAAALSYLASASHARGELAQAQESYERVLAVCRKVHGPDHPSVASALNNLGTVHADRGDDAGALKCYEEALALFCKRLGERSHDAVVCLNNIGLLRRKLGQRQAALEAFTRAVNASRRPGTAGDGEPDLEDLGPVPFTAQVLHYRALLLEESLGAAPTVAQLRRCAAAYALAADLTDRLRRDVLAGETGKLVLGADRSNLVVDRLRVARRLFERTGDAGELEAALTAIGQGRARVFLESLGRSRADRLGGVDPKLLERERDLRARLARLGEVLREEQARPAERRDPRLVARLLEEERGLNAEWGKLVARMARDYPQYAALLRPRPCTLAQARACLDDGEVAVLFALDRKESYGLLLEKRPRPGEKGRGLTLVRLPGAEALARQVRTLADRDVLRSDSRVRAMGAELHALLLGPLAARIGERDLLVVPDDVLWELPFELLAEKGGKYLVERRRVRYAPSLAALHLVGLWEQKRPVPAGPLWAAGDPVYRTDDPRLKGKGAGELPAAVRAARREYLARFRGGPPKRLPASGDEVRALPALLRAPPGSVVTGLAASEALVKAASERGLLARPAGSTSRSTACSLRGRAGNPGCSCARSATTAGSRAAAPTTAF